MHFDGCRYIAARPFDTELGHYEPGDEVEEAPQLHYLEAFINTGLLYRYFPDEEQYAWLPAHLFSLVQTRDEALAKIAGDPSHGQTPQYQGEKPEVVKESEAQAEVQAQVYDQMLSAAAKNREAHLKRQAEADKKLSARVENERKDAEGKQVSAEESERLNETHREEGPRAAKKAAAESIKRKSADKSAEKK